MTKTIISKDKLLESGLHYGHQTRSWNPAMKPFIAMSKRNIHFIDIEKSTRSLENSYNIVKKITERRGTFLFVGTQRQSSKTVRENAERVGAFYIDHRWLGGLLTNFRTIQNSVNKLRRLERLAKDNFEGYTKKEAILMQKELDKLEKTLGGIKFMRRLPQAIFVTSIRNEEIAIKEAKKMGIPVFGIADTNVDPYDVNFPIFGNDDANKAVSLVTTVIADAIAAGKGEAQKVAYIEDDKVEIIGIEERTERPQRTYNNNRNDRPERAPRRTEEVKPAAKKEEVKPVVVKEEVKPAEVKEEVKPVEVKEEVKEVKAKPAKAEDTDAAAKKAEKEAKAKAKQEKMRKDLLAKMAEKESKDFSDIKLTELYGVGPSTEKYFDTLGWDIETLSKLDVDSIEDEKIENLPGLKSIKFETRKAKIASAVEEAKFIVSNI